jgi:O-antigen chain-terminating methyltransferase
MAAPNLDDLKAGLEELADKHFDPEAIRTASRLPGGGTVHRALAKVMSRQTVGILDQVRDFADSVRHVLRRMVATLEDPRGHVHHDLVGRFDSIFERLAFYERGSVDSPGAVADLRLRVEQLEELERRRRFRPWFRNDRFEDEFRGSKEDLLNRYRDLAQHFAGSGPVMDIGCGRGEFLELLRDSGVEASGVELDPELAKAASETGLDVLHGDGLNVLANAPDESLGGISLIQVVEHLTPQQVLELVLLTKDKLRPGGKVVVETVNPQSLYVFAHSFYLDPTHAQPIHPAYLTFLFREAGFSGVAVDWRSPPSADESLMEPDSNGAADEAISENWRRLNRLLFAHQDYALLAIR